MILEVLAIVTWDLSFILMIRATNTTKTKQTNHKPLESHRAETRETEWMKPSVTCEQAANQTERDGGHVTHGPRETQPTSSCTSTEKNVQSQRPSVCQKLPSAHIPRSWLKWTLPFFSSSVSTPLSVQAQGVGVPFPVSSLCAEDGKGHSLNNRVSLIAAPEGRLPLWDKRDIPPAALPERINQTS